MDLSTFHRLLTVEGRSALAIARELNPSESTVLNCLDRLRKSFDPDLARAAVEMVLLRERARAKFARAGEMFFTREALEQASGEIIAAYRAKRFASYARVADLCCGIGADAIVLGSAGRSVVAVESDPVRAAMAVENLRVNGVSAEVRVADALTTDLSAVDAAFCDPGRRPGGRRVLDLPDYEPPPQSMRDRLPTGFPLAFKVAPGVPLKAVMDFGGEFEFVSVHGELKECVLWQGPLATSGRRATVLPGGDTLTDDGKESFGDVTPIGRYLYDPDPAVVRARLDYGVLAGKLGLTSFEPNVAGLTGDKEVTSPFVTGYRVEEVLPFHVKKVGAWLKTRGIGRVTPVKNGVDVDTDAVLKVWKLTGSEHRTVIFTRANGRVVAVVAERLSI